jgi:hypothetical protein
MLASLNIAILLRCAAAARLSHWATAPAAARRPNGIKDRGRNEHAGDAVFLLWMALGERGVAVDGD